MLTTQANKVALKNRRVLDGWTCWEFEVVRNGRIWNVSRTWSPEGHHMDKITEKHNPTYIPYPTSPVAEAIGRMVTKHIIGLSGTAEA